MATLVELTANIVTSNVSGSGLSSDDLVAEINKVFVALKSLETFGLPSGTAKPAPSSAEQPVVLTFSNPVYSQMQDINDELPVFEIFEREMVKQNKGRKGAAAGIAPKPERKISKDIANSVKPSTVAVKSAAIKETSKPKTIKTAAKAKKMKV